MVCTRTFIPQSCTVCLVFWCFNLLLTPMSESSFWVASSTIPGKWSSSSASPCLHKANWLCPVALSLFWKSLWWIPETALRSQLQGHCSGRTSHISFYGVLQASFSAKSEYLHSLPFEVWYVICQGWYGCDEGWHCVALRQYVWARHYSFWLACSKVCSYNILVIWIYIYSCC